MSLRERGIGASVHFDPPVHLHNYYRREFPDVHLPVTEEVASSIVTLPMFPGLRRDELEEVVDTIDDVLVELHRANKQCA